MIRWTIPLLALGLAPLSAGAGGLCDPATGAGCATATPPGFARPAPAAPAPAPAPGAGLSVDTGAEARAYYRDRLTDLWKAETNGTCLGVEGAWHLTPTHMVAEGILYEILGFAGPAARFQIAARRVSDYAPAAFTMTPLGRSRLDILGDVAGDYTHYNVALRRC